MNILACRLLLRRAALTVLVTALAACAAAPPHAAVTPLLRLSPTSLGEALAYQQQLVIESGGQAHRVDVLLEADGQSVRLVALSLGQVAARLEWDGMTLKESRAPWWPAAIRGDRILSDLQLMLWPAQAIAAALPSGWTLQSSAESRTLSHNGVAVIRVAYLSGTQSELVHLLDRYRIWVESRALRGTP